MRRNFTNERDYLNTVEQDRCAPPCCLNPPRPKPPPKPDTRSASATADTSASVISGGENEICLFSIVMFLASGIKYAKHPA